MTKKKDPTSSDPNKNYIDELNKKYGAGNEIRTRDLHVGNVMLYH